MISIDRLTKSYGEFTAVDSLSLDIPDGQLTVLLGPSGSGKTTVLRMINRMVAPTSGHVLMDGVDLSSRKPEHLRRDMGYVIQNSGLFPNMTVNRNVGTVPRLLGWDPARVGARVAEMLDLVGLDPDVYGTKMPSQLSGGEAQRVGVARALAADPPVILMDEPFGAVDPLTRTRLQVELKSLHRRLKKTIIFVTHDIDEAVLLADKIALLKAGALQQYATVEEIWKRPANEFVASFFGRDLGLRIMQRHVLASVPLLAMAGNEAGEPHVSDSATLKDALAALVDSPTGRIVVTRNGLPVGVATFASLTSALSEDW